MENSLKIQRKTYSKKQFDDEFLFKDVETRKSSKKSTLKSFILIFHPKNLLGIFTILNWITEYDFKNNLIADILSGLTVGVMHIPAALAYGALTSLNPVHGLYTSFYTGLVYVFFGTSRHLSVGTFAVTSLMVYSTVFKLEQQHLMRINNNELNDSMVNDLFNPNSTFKAGLISENHDIRIKIATALAFWCGIFQILFSLLRFGDISKYLSLPLLRGFTTGAACHVLTTQLRHIFGIRYPRSGGKSRFKIISTLTRLIQNVNTINWTAVIFSAIAITFLLVMKIYVNDRYKKKLRNIPIPIELIVIVTGTVVTYFAKLDEKFDLQITGEIPKGFPDFYVPDFVLIISLFQDALIISIIAFATSLSVSGLYARKHKYRINSNKELFALGMANVVGSFFQCFVSCGALARTAVLESSGGKTQLVTVIASGIVALVMLWISPLLYTLPKACLGSIIAAALHGLLKQLSDIPYYWKIDKLDFLTWIITFLSTITFDIDVGLTIGVLTVLALNTYRSQNMKLTVVGRVSDYEIYSDITKYSAREYDDIKIIRPTHSIFYINADYFRRKINEMCPLKEGLKVLTICENCKVNYPCCFDGCKSKQNEGQNQSINNEANDSGEMGQMLSQSPVKLQSSRTEHHNCIIVDFSMVQFVDETGTKCLKEMIQEYNNEQVKFLLTNCSDSVLEFFAKMKFDVTQISFITVQDALASIVQ